jgi:hypothetical protein
MATASVLPDVAARIAPQMGGGSGAETSLLPTVGDSSMVRAQYGGALDENEKKFINLLKDMGLPLPSKKGDSKIMKEDFTEENYGQFILFIKRKQKGIEQSKFDILMKKIKKEVNESQIENIQEIRKPILEELNKFEEFINQFKFYTTNKGEQLKINSQKQAQLNKFNTNFEEFKERFYDTTVGYYPNSKKIIETSIRILLLNDYINGTPMKPIDGRRLILITEAHENYKLGENGVNTGNFREYRDKIRKEVEKLKMKEEGEKTNVIPSEELKAANTVAETKVENTVVETKPANATPSALEVSSKMEVVQAIEPCYERLREEMTKNPDFTSVIEKLMSQTSGDLKDLLYNPSHAEVRKLLREMITLKVEQFKSALREARGEEEEGVNVGIQTENMSVETENAAVGTNAGTVPVAKMNATIGTNAAAEKMNVAIGTNAVPAPVANAVPAPVNNTESVENIPAINQKTPIVQSITSPINSLFETYFEEHINYGGFKAPLIIPTTLQKLQNNDRETIKNYYNSFDFQREALCGLHAINNLFIEERTANPKLKKFERKIFDDLCNIMVNEGLEGGCPPSGYYHKDLMIKFLKKQGYETPEIGALESFIGEISEIISTKRSSPDTRQNVYNKMRDKMFEIGGTLEDAIFNKLFSIALKSESSEINKLNDDEKAIYEIIVTFLEQEVNQERNIYNLLRSESDNLEFLKTNVFGNENNLGLILGNGGHWISLRRLDANHVDFRNSMNFIMEPFKIINTSEDYIPHIYNSGQLVEIIEEIYINNGTSTIIIVNKPASAPVLNESEENKAKAQTAGSKTRHRRHRSIRPKKTKRHPRQKK